MSVLLNPVPPIDREANGTSWTQPDPNAFVWNNLNGSVTISEKEFAELREYSTTNPSGVYPGKMWKSEYPDGWYLRWYAQVPTNHTLCSLTSYKIYVEVSP